MAEVKIKARDNGPLLVTGKIQLLDGADQPIETQETVALCRCGRSENKPFCDGSHKGHFEEQTRAK